MIIVVALLLLFTCWSLYGWYIGDSCNIRWIRHWCGLTFVIMVAVLSAGTGFMAARIKERGDARSAAEAAMQAISVRLAAGDIQTVKRELRSLDHSADPDRDAWDLLEELPQLAERLNPSPVVTEPRPTEPHLPPPRLADRREDSSGSH